MARRGIVSKGRTIRSRAAPAAVSAIVAVLLAGCSPTASSTPQWTTGPSPSEDFRLVIDNLDGPPLDLAVNGSIRLHVVCDPQGTIPAPELSPASLSVPLPWALELRRADGSSFGRFTVTGDAGPMRLVIRTIDAGLFRYYDNIGPAPQPTCAR